MVQIRRIDLADAAVDQTIANLCIILEAANYKLVSTFVYGNILVLIFQD